MKKRIFFVFNMHAGKARIKTKLSDILNTFTEKGYEVTAYPTQYAGEAVLRIEALEDGYELVVCSGGDGTLDEVVTGMMVVNTGKSICIHGPLRPQELKAHGKRPQKRLVLVTRLSVNCRTQRSLPKRRRLKTWQTCVVSVLSGSM